MLKPLAVLMTAAGLAVAVGAADVVQLKDKASITGTILAEKKDLVVVDLGYTVLTVPRNQIASISREAKPGGRPSSSPSPKDTATPVTNAPPPVAAPRDGSLFTSAPGTGPERPLRDLVRQHGEAVVQVRTPAGLGSGFILNSEGYLITNYHVVENETQISVEVYHQRDGQLERKVYRQIRIVAMNKFVDLALLRIEDVGSPQFTSVPLGTTDALAVGERVFAIGSPLGLERTVTEGILSTKTRELQGELYLQTTAQINPGNSGGPLFNLRGEVIGVTNMKLTFGEGLGFAIPVEQVRYFLQHRDAFAYDNDNPSNPFRYLEPPRRLKQGAVGPEASR